MQTCGWPLYVNKKILDETTITIGEGGFVEDATSSGYSERRLTGDAIPDSFQVVMDFDWGGVDPKYPIIDGLSEYDRFVRWYKFIHLRGSKPFWFPCITKHSVNNINYNDYSDMCLYKITSSLQPKKSGYSQRITMTWKEVYSGTIEVEEKKFELDHITCYRDRIQAVFSGESDTEPVFDKFHATYEGSIPTELPIIRIDGYVNEFNLYFDPSILETAATPGGSTYFRIQLTYDGVTKQTTYRGDKR